MGSNVYKGSKKARVSKYLVYGYSVKEITELLDTTIDYVRFVMNNTIAKKVGRKITTYTRDSFKPLSSKLQPYYSNEMDYGKQKLKYNYEECKTEYDLVGKEPTFFGERKDVTIKTFSRVVNPNQSN
jgi:hypothetical protein